MMARLALAIIAVFLKVRFLKNFFEVFCLYKDIIRDVCRKVTNRKNKRKYPRIIDYVDAIIENENANFFKENGDEVIRKKREKIRRSVSHALEVLEKENVLGKIDGHYVPIKTYDEYVGRKFLLENLLPEKNKLVRVSKRVYMLPFKNECVSKKTCNSVNNNSSVFKNASPEIKELKKQLNVLIKDYNVRKRVDKLKTHLNLFLGNESYITIFTIDNSFIMVIDSDNDENLKQITNRLNELISDILKNQNKPYKLTKKK